MYYITVNCFHICLEELLRGPFLPSPNFFVSEFIPVSEMEETMLSVLRPSQKTSDRVVSSPSTSSRPPVDPSELPPDKLHVEMELSPDSQITLYGPLLNAFFCIKV